MPNVLLLGEEYRKIKRTYKKISQLQGWGIFELHPLDVGSKKIKNYLKQNNIHYVILHDIPNGELLKIIEEIQIFNPLIFIIYCNSFLHNKQFMKIYKAGIHSCLIGNNRQMNLENYLLNLWEKHWQRIPLALIEKESENLSARAKKIIHFIEDNSLDCFTIASISRYLKISESHCCAEIKSLIGLNFREFKQRLLNHYETILLFDKHLKPSEVYHILNYKNLPNYSRSFKSRHGKSWRFMASVSK